MCQKAFGSVGGLLVTAHDLVWTRGAPAHFASSDTVRRGFCRDCGTPLTFEEGEGVDVAIAAFDRAQEIVPVIQLASDARLRWLDDLGAIPGPSPEEAVRQSARYQRIASRQHPDHDTDYQRREP